MFSKRIVLWRWAKPSEKFTPKKHEYFSSLGIRFKSHNEVVLAGLNPIDWMEIMKGEKEVLHKIVLTREEAKKCVVAKGEFSYTNEEITEFAESKHISIVNIEEKYISEHYEKTFVSLLEYSGEYNLPEVLIPFPVKAGRVSFEKGVILIWKLKKRITVLFNLG